MSQIPGTNVSAPIVPQTTDDTYPTHDAQYGKGGLHSVSDLTARDAIPVARRSAGMIVSVANDRDYQLGADLVTWTGLKTDAENAAALASGLGTATAPLLEWTTQIVTTVDGSFMAANGTVTTNNSYRYATLPIAAGTRIRVTSAANNSAAYLAVYFDANSAVISFQTQGDGVTAYTNFELTVPATARSIAINGRTTQAIVVQTYILAPNVAPRLTGAEAALASTSSTLALAVAAVQVWTTQTATTVDGSYINDDGVTLVANSTYRYATLNFAAGASVRVTSAALQSAVSLAIYYDASGNKIGTQTKGDGTTAYSNFVLTVPANARKVVINGRTTAPIAIQTIDYIPNLGPRLNAAETQAATNASDISNLKTATTKISATLQDWVSTTATSAVDGSYMGLGGNINTGGVPTVNASYRYAVISGLTSGAQVRVTSAGLQTAVYLANYYDASGAYISREGQGTANAYSKYMLTIPSNATTVVVNGRTTAPIVLETIGVAANIAARVSALEAATVVAAPTTPITLLGDSTMAQGSGIALGMVAQYPSRTVYQQAIAGSRAPMVAARIGAIPLALTVTGGSIPTGGSVRCVPSVFGFLGGTSACSVRVMILGVLCDLTWDPTLDSNTGGYNLTPVAYPPTAVAVPNGTVAKVLTGWIGGASAAAAIPLATLLSGVVLLRIGVNDLAGGVDLDSTLDLMNAMYTQIRRYTAKTLIYGVMPGGIDLPTSQGGSVASDANSYVILSKEVSFNTSGANLFAPFWIDPAANHKALGGTEAKTVLGVSFDAMTTTAPSPITTDGRHEASTVISPATTAGQAQTVALTAAAISARGW